MLPSDGNRYSVPPSFAFQMVSVKGYVDRVVIVVHGQVVATHERSLEKQTMILDPIHYLVVLGRKPGAMMPRRFPVTGSSPRASPRCVLNWNGSTLMGGSRRFVRVLQLLGEHPMARVTQAIETCRPHHLHMPRP